MYEKIALAWKMDGSAVAALPKKWCEKLGNAFYVSGDKFGAALYDDAAWDAAGKFAESLPEDERKRLRLFFSIAVRCELKKNKVTLSPKTAFLVSGVEKAPAAIVPGEELYPNVPAERRPVALLVNESLAKAIYEEE